ncbi:MAG: hypothetical protein Q8O47_01515 [Candidatus Bathyarchaeota archaeon]|nr:hypothetical protein [Candidatus Bathyarchaeota archaeon]
MIANIAVAYPTDPLAIAGLWTALLLMLAIYSYPLWKENPVYRFAEHTFVATALAIGIIVNLQSLMNTAVTPLLKGGWNFLLIIPIILGFCMYFLLVPKQRWVSRYPIAILVGSSLGLGIASTPLPSIVSQIISTVNPPTAGTSIWAMFPSSPRGDWFSFVFVAAGCICATMYFLLTYEHTGAVKPVTIAGRYFIMLALGAYFGNTVLFRFSMLAERGQYILKVLGIVPL